MKNRFEISIGEVEGLEYGNYEYKITLDTMEQFLYDTNIFELQGDGNFSFALLQNNFILGGFTIPISSLRKTPKTWFPLENPFKELMHMPNSIEGPRISFEVRPLSLNTVIEISESSKESSMFSSRILEDNTLVATLKQEIAQKNDIILGLEEVIEKTQGENLRLQNIVDDLAENFYKFQNENKERTDALIEENAGIKAQIAGHEQIKIKLTEEVASLKRTIEILQYKLSFREITSEKIEVCDLEGLMSRLKESEGKRKELQQVLNSANNTWHDIKVNNHTQMYLEKENKNLISRVKTLTEQVAENNQLTVVTEDPYFMKQMHNLSIKLTHTKEKNKDLKGQMEALKSENAQYEDIIERYRNDLSKQAEENSDLSGQLKSALGKIPKREEKVDPIDKALKQYFKETQSKNPFVKIAEGIYNYGNKRLAFNLKNGIPVVRVGGGYMFVDEFLKMYNTHYKKKEETPIRSQSLESKSQNTLRVKGKVETESEIKTNEMDSPGGGNEIKILKRVPRQVFIP